MKRSSIGAMTRVASESAEEWASADIAGFGGETT